MNRAPLVTERAAAGNLADEALQHVVLYGSRGQRKLVAFSPGLNVRAACPLRVIWMWLAGMSARVQALRVMDPFEPTFRYVAGVTTAYLGKQMAGQASADTMVLIKRAIQDRMCLSGRHHGFRVRFAPHALGHDEKYRHVVAAFEYGGLTLGQANWMSFMLDRLHGLQITADQWRTGPLASRLQFGITRIEVAVDASWGGYAKYT